MAQTLALKRFAKGILGLAGAVLALLSIAGLVGRHGWLLDLASHFRVQYFLVAVGLAGLALAARWYRHAVLPAAVGVLNGVLILPLFLPPAEPPPGPVLRAMLINLYSGNTGYDAVMRSVREHDPDFLVAEEVTERWATALRALAADYPHAIVRARPDNFGIALYSKRPFAASEVVMLGDVGLPSVLAEFDSHGRNFFLLATHAPPPISSEYDQRRRRHLASLTPLVHRLGAPVLLLGDLNASPWSYPFRRLLDASGLRDGSLGRGFQPTWPAGLWPLLIPIDHSLHSAGIGILERVVGPPLGSDHYPVIVDFTL